jgi:arsenical pump membrane protein
MADAIALPFSLLALAATLGVAVLRPRRVPDALAAGGGAVILIAIGAIGSGRAATAVRELGPTVGFLAALLLIAEGCRREGLFEALGDLIAQGSGGDARRFLGLVFAAASCVTIVLGLDATVVLLPPIVLATATALRASPRASIYACVHLANSASLLLPVSNLTNLLAFRASGLSFARFAALMALPTVGVIAVEWIVISRRFGVGSGGSATASPAPSRARALPRFPVAVLALTLLGFALSSALSIQPVWIAVAGAVAINLPAVASGRSNPVTLVTACEPGFLIFVLGLGVIVAAASTHGLSTAVRDVLPAGASLGDLLLIAAVSAILANLVNNLPATLILVPVTAALGAGPVLATLVGVNVGPNLTQVGSLATLLWRRVLRTEGVEVEPIEFTRLGLVTVPPALIGGTALLWLALRL